LTADGASSGTILGGTAGMGGGAMTWEGGGGGGYLGDGANADIARGGQSFVNGSAGGISDETEACGIHYGGFGGGGGSGNDLAGGGGGYSGGAAQEANSAGFFAGGGGSYAIAPATIELRSTRGHGSVQLSW
jgi:hypothetical protein